MREGFFLLLSSPGLKRFLISSGVLERLGLDYEGYFLKNGLGGPLYSRSLM